MATQWFCMGKNRVIGPIESKQLINFARTGKVLRSTPVRKGVNGQWVTANRVKGLFRRQVASKTNAESARTAAEPCVCSEDDPKTWVPSNSTTVQIVPRQVIALTWSTRSLMNRMGDLIKALMLFVARQLPKSIGWKSTSKVISSKPAEEQKLKV
jgi:hypothetical protein